MTIHFYGIPNCDTVKKARTWLDAKGRDFEFHDFKKEGADQDLVRGWVQAVGWERVLNRQGTTFRKLEPAQMYHEVADDQDRCIDARPDLPAERREQGRGLAAMYRLEARMREAWSDPKVANIVYHDWEASTYDEKWSISYDDRCISYARDRYVHVAGDEGWPAERMLEIGAGTGFFTLNLMQAGLAKSAVVTDISQGMVDVAVRNGRALGLDVEGQAADAEALPFAEVVREVRRLAGDFEEAELDRETRRFCDVAWQRG